LLITRNDVECIEEQIERGDGDHYRRGQHGAFISIVETASGYEINAFRDGTQLSETRNSIDEAAKLFFEWKRKY